MGLGIWLWTVVHVEARTLLYPPSLYWALHHSQYGSHKRLNNCLIWNILDLLQPIS